MNVITTATWRALDLFQGRGGEFINHHTQQSYKAIFPKVGNGLTGWVGLGNHFIKAGKAGLKKWGWWYLYGHKGEGSKIGLHSTILELDLIALDIESHWENNAGWTATARANKAQLLLDSIRGAGFTGDIALCSWWNTDLHPRVPYKIFAKGCNYNMPQLYWIGRFSEAQASDLVKSSLDMYDKLGFEPERTIPVLASFGQRYGQNNKYWWKTTIPQMNSAYLTALNNNCAGATFYSTDYLLGGAGHEAPAKVETAMLQAIKDMTGAVTPPPTPIKDAESSM